MLTGVPGLPSKPWSSSASLLLQSVLAPLVWPSLRAGRQLAAADAVDGPRPISGPALAYRQRRQASGRQLLRLVAAIGPALLAVEQTPVHVDLMSVMCRLQATQLRTKQLHNRCQGRGHRWHRDVLHVVEVEGGRLPRVLHRLRREGLVMAVHKAEEQK